MYVTSLIWSEGHILHLLQGGLQFSELISKCYHLVVSVDLEDVGGHLSVHVLLMPGVIPLGHQW